MLGEIKLEELCRIMSEALDKAFGKPVEMMRRANQRLLGLEQEARQSRLATEANAPTDTKTHKRIEDAEANQAKNGDSYSAKKVQAGPISTSFVMKAESPALPRRDDVLVDISATALKPYLSPVKMRTLTAAGGLLPTGKTSTATKIIFHQLPLWFFLTKEIKFRTSQCATDYSNFWKLKILETKSRQNLVFDPGGCTDHLRAYTFLEAWHALLCGEVFCQGAGWYPRLQRFLADR